MNMSGQSKMLSQVVEITLKNLQGFEGEMRMQNEMSDEKIGGCRG